MNKNISDLTRWKYITDEMEFFNFVIMNDFTFRFFLGLVSITIHNANIRTSIPTFCYIRNLVLFEQT